MMSHPPSRVLRLSSKGQVVLPKKIRDYFSVAEGSLISCEVTPEGILLRPVATVPAKRKGRE